MKTKKIICELTPDEIVNHPFLTKDGKLDFYSFIAKHLTGKSDDWKVDCRKINVAKNILNSWYDYVTENGLSEQYLTTNLAVYGPKALDTVPDNCVEIEEYGITIDRRNNFQTDALDNIGNNGIVQNIANL